MEKFGFVYETTNVVTQKKYIGSHIGPSEDIYLGSGTSLLQDIETYGKDKFERKILSYASGLGELRELEKAYLTKVDAKNNPMYYNRTNQAAGITKKMIDKKERPVCPCCTQKPVAVNCIKKGVTYYRKLCDICARLGKSIKPSPPKWYKSGYRKKPHCERCGFKAEVPEQQLLVYHVDGDLSNNDRSNLKTVCLNCRPLIQKSRLPWKPADLVPDF
jgi:hypothetical protein